MYGFCCPSQILQWFSRSGFRSFVWKWFWLPAFQASDSLQVDKQVRNEYKQTDFSEEQAVKLLSISDKQYRLLHSPGVRERFGDADFVIGCGDLPYYYLEYISETLRVPLFYVRGNHNFPEEFYRAGALKSPRGCLDLHRRLRHWNGILLAGVEGSLQYNNRGYYQSTQSEMWLHVFSLVPGMLLNKWRYGRYLDIFVSHAPPWDIHDEKDRTHQGIKAFRWLLQTFQPHYHFHGHIHVYQLDTQTETQFGKTLIINTYGFRETMLELSANQNGHRRFA
ncbi:MAG TPA: metallophosphoesterase [Chloroflexi bacterium]|nr:metallophosphoesterase [Chloroflexota bacterium]